MGSAYGLQTHIWNNNSKTVLLMAGISSSVVVADVWLVPAVRGLTGTYYGNDPMTGYFHLGW